MSIQAISTNQVSLPPIESPEKVYRDLLARTFQKAVVMARCESRSLYPYSQIRVDVYGKGESKPIILFSHGYGVDAICYHHLLEKLASEGYAVVAINHPSSAMGKDSDESPDRLALLEQMQKNNIQRVIKEIRNGQLKGVGNPKHILLAGHSIGGAASLLASKSQGVQGVINLDGGLRNGNVNIDHPNSKPVLTVLGDHAKDGPESQSFLESWDTFSKANDSPPVVIPRTNHMDFVFGFSVLDKRSYVAQKTEDIAVKAILQFAESTLDK
jgi:dienelactone hydrolase